MAVLITICYDFITLNQYYWEFNAQAVIRGKERMRVNTKEDIEKKVNYSRPSIDVLFESAADVFGPRPISVILTGANNDGAQGLWCVKAKGGLTVEIPHLTGSSGPPCSLTVTAKRGMLRQL